MKAPNRKTPSTAQALRHARILDQTKRLMSQVGADRMTVRDLAIASAVAPGTIYNRFGSKDQVISLAVIDHFEKVIRSRLNNYAGAKSPLDKIVLGLDLIASDCLKGPAFASAMMSAYFKVGVQRRMLGSLYQALYDIWLPVLLEMQQGKLLRPWVLAAALCVEICDREFGVVVKWVQGDMPQADLRERSRFAVLSILLGASRGRQATQIEALLQDTLKRIARAYRRNAATPGGESGRGR